MLPSRDEHAKTQKPKLDGRLAEEVKRLEHIAQSEVAAKNITGQAGWDLFLSYVAAAQRECDVRIEELREAITDPMAVEQGQLMRLKVLLEGWIQRKNAFEAVMGIPKDLLETGEKAKALLERMPELETE